MGEVSHLPCGACGMDEGQVIGRPRVSDKIKALTDNWPAIRVVRCSNCGFYYADPMPFWDKKELQTLYDAEYFGRASRWWQRIRTQVDPERRLLAIEKEYRRKGSRPRLLDIGCGQGYLLERALRRGWEVLGVEPSEAWASGTAARLGVEVRAEAVEEVQIPEASYDIVFSDSVIEHLGEPLALMKLARWALRGDGVAYLVTPNADALVNRFRGMLFQVAGLDRAPQIEPLCSPYHVVGFTPGSLKVCAQRAGLKVRRLWLKHGMEECHKYCGWTAARFKSLALWPALCLGEISQMGTTIEALLVPE